MKIQFCKFLCLTFLLVGSSAKAELFSIRTDVPYATERFVEILFGRERGKSFSVLLKEIPLKQNKISFRLLGQFSEFTNEELLKYYQSTIPTEYAAALRSSGNLHNPKLSEMRFRFKQAFEQTTLLKQIAKAMVKSCYSLKSIRMEKFTLNTKNKDAPRLDIGEIWLGFSKGQCSIR
ncbi:MAG: hypothetical protein MJK04_16355 [Psychrosphaera sp.]|nr:hypothetical protein [Psychrosphaera sp.]